MFAPQNTHTHTHTLQCQPYTHGDSEGRHAVDLRDNLLVRSKSGVRFALRGTTLMRFIFCEFAPWFLFPETKRSVLCICSFFSAGESAFPNCHSTLMRRVYPRHRYHPQCLHRLLFFFLSHCMSTRFLEQQDCFLKKKRNECKEYQPHFDAPFFSTCPWFAFFNELLGARVPADSACG